MHWGNLLAGIQTFFLMFLKLIKNPLALNDLFQS